MRTIRQLSQHNRTNLFRVKCRQPGATRDVVQEKPELFAGPTEGRQATRGHGAGPGATPGVRETKAQHVRTGPSGDIAQGDR